MSILTSSPGLLRLFENGLPLLDDAPVLKIIDPHRGPHALKRAVGRLLRLFSAFEKNIVDRVDVRFPFCALGADGAQLLFEDTDQELFADAVSRYVNTTLPSVWPGSSIRRWVGSVNILPFTCFLTVLAVSER